MGVDRLDKINVLGVTMAPICRLCKAFHTDHKS